MDLPIDMQHQAMGYDRTATMFSPEGKLLQVEYAEKAIRLGSASVGMNCSDGVFVIADKRIDDKLITQKSTNKIHEIDFHIMASSAGIVSDARILIERAQVLAQQHRVTYDSPIEPELIIKEISNIKQQFTQYGGARPFGVIGWLKDEFEFLGVPFEDRAALSEDCLNVMKTLWTDEHPRLTTAYGTIDRDVNFGPQPVQKPHPPIWIGGNTMPALRRVARWGDGWQPVFLSPDAIQNKCETLQSLMEEAGRDATQLEITTLVGAQVSVAEAQAYQAAGVQALYMLTTTDQPDELFAQVKQFVATMREVGNI